MYYSILFLGYYLFLSSCESNAVRVHGMYFVLFMLRRGFFFKKKKKIVLRRRLHIDVTHYYIIFITRIIFLNLRLLFSFQSTSSSSSSLLFTFSVQVFLFARRSGRSTHTDCSNKRQL